MEIARKASVKTRISSGGMPPLDKQIREASQEPIEN